MQDARKCPVVSAREYPSSSTLPKDCGGNQRPSGTKATALPKHHASTLGGPSSDPSGVLPLSSRRREDLWSARPARSRIHPASARVGFAAGSGVGVAGVGQRIRQVTTQTTSTNSPPTSAPTIAHRSRVHSNNFRRSMPRPSARAVKRRRPVDEARVKGYFAFRVSTKGQKPPMTTATASPSRPARSCLPVGSAGKLLNSVCRIISA